MPPLRTGVAGNGFRRFYEPARIRIMSDALDLACRMLPAEARESESVRRRLALHILHGVDAGERDPMRLGTSAAFSLRL